MATAVLHDGPVALPEARRDGKQSAHASHEEVAVGVHVLVDSAQDPVGEDEQPRAEHVDDEVEAIEQRDAAEDGEAAEHERRDDAPEELRRAVLRGHREVREEQEEDEEVVQRERALDQVDRRVVDRGVGAVEEQQRDGDQEREHEPADAPHHALAEARLATAREDLEVDEQQNDDRGRDPGEGDRAGERCGRNGERHAKKNATASTT